MGSASSPIKCADCGGWFAHKYRRVIYRCNGKYKGKKCQIPHVTEEEVKEAFISAYNKLVSEKEEIIANAKIIWQTFYRTGVLEEEKHRLENDMAVLAEMT